MQATINQYVDRFKDNCQQAYMSCSKVYHEAGVADKVNSTVLGGACVYVIRHFIQHEASLLALQWTLAFGITRVIYEVAQNKIPALRMEGIGANEFYITSSAFHRNIARAAVVLTVGCVTTAFVCHNSALMLLIPRIVVIQTLCMACKVPANVLPFLVL